MYCFAAIIPFPSSPDEQISNTERGAVVNAAPRGWLHAPHAHCDAGGLALTGFGLRAGGPGR
jgi:hypothetical protein